MNRLNDLLPRPHGTTPVRCPSCGHRISAHDKDYTGPEVQNVCHAGGKGLCRCLWSINDIAWSLLHGDLTHGTVISSNEQIRGPRPNPPRRTLPWL